MITVMISTDLLHQNEHFTVRNPLDYQKVVPFMLSSYMSKFGRLLVVFPGCFTLLFLLPGVCTLAMWLKTALRWWNFIMNIGDPLDSRERIGLVISGRQKQWKVAKSLEIYVRCDEFHTSSYPVHIMRYSEWTFIGKEISSHRPHSGSHWYCAFLSQIIPGLEHLKWMI